MYDLLQAFNMLVVAGYNVNLLIIGGNIKEDIEPFRDEFMNYVHKNNLTLIKKKNKLRNLDFETVYSLRQCQLQAHRKF